MGDVVDPTQLDRDKQSTGFLAGVFKKISQFDNAIINYFDVHSTASPAPMPFRRESLSMALLPERLTTA